MTDPNTDKPGRRPRYPGKNPRAFDQKYKEHQPSRYPVDVAKVLEAGKTPAGSHRPIMVREILDILSPKPGEVVVDATLGFGGHARELLAAVQPGGRLIGVDADPIECSKTEARLRELGYPPEAVLVRRMNFAGLAPLVLAESPEGADVVLADLGLSSMQIDDPARGFTFKVDGPLDMRMNPQKGRSAAELLSNLGVAKLARLLTENADEPFAHDLASAILSAHATRPLATTRELASVVRSTCPRSADEAVRRVFQALRIAVNDEFGSLDALLRGLPGCLKPGWDGSRSSRSTRARTGGSRPRSRPDWADGTYASIASEPLRPSAEERRANPRSTSAKLRHAVRA